MNIVEQRHELVFNVSPPSLTHPQRQLNVSGRVYGMALHPASDIQEVFVGNGSSRHRLTAGCPLVFEGGVIAPDVRMVDRVTLGEGNLIVEVAESPSDIERLTRVRPTSARIVKTVNLSGDAADPFTSRPGIFVDVPHARARARIASDSSWTGAAWAGPPTFEASLVAYYQSIPGKGDAVIGDGLPPMRAWQFASVAVVMGGPAWALEADVPPGATAVMAMVRTTAGADPTVRSFELFAAVTSY